MMVGLFTLVFLTMLLIIFGYFNFGIFLTLTTLVLSIFLFMHHITQTIGINL